MVCLTAFSIWGKAQNVAKTTTEQYIQQYKDVAIAEMKRSRIPASITLAQGILESGNGNSRLATEANNHFGIKCKKEWTGRTLYEDDDAPQECFRAYPTAEDSYRDHSDFLVKSARYAFLFDLAPTDYKGWAEGLKKAGYATNPNYPQLLINFIEKHNLQQYDGGELNIQPALPAPVTEKKEEIKPVPAPAALKEWNNLPVTIAAKGESYAQIALRNDMMVWQIFKYNDIKRGANPRSGDTLYLKPKFNKGKVATYEVQFGDNMYRISQRFAIKLKSLYKLNKMEFGTEPMWGEVLNLQGKRKEMPRLRTRQDEMFRPLLIPQLPPPAPIPAEVVIKKDSIKVVQLQQPTQVKPEEKKIEPEQKNMVVHDSANTVKPQPVIEEIKAMPADTAQVRKEVETEKATQRLEQLVQTESDTMVQNDTTTSYLKEEQITISEKPQENMDAVAADLKELPLAQRADSTIDNSEETFLHTVQPKETLYSISRKYNLKVAVLKDLNKLTTDSIQIGQQLIVNQHQSGFKRSSNIKTGIHVVEEQETLYGIARKYNITVDELIALNQLTDLNARVGQELIILQNQKAAPKEEVKPQVPVYHIVQAKETFYSISRKYNVPIDELLKLNNKTDFILSIGQQVRVK
ncbi:MAG TPA: LysM peptidoglycan-binding domain-containing protein [Bacteroidia bacterium]|nr:LysM peptidoglycan-binding domain-containing protein [Bacteroidia bacterium]